jgi:hypothetical protein
MAVVAEQQWLQERRLQGMVFAGQRWLQKQRLQGMVIAGRRGFQDSSGFRS